MRRRTNETPRDRETVTHAMASAGVIVALGIALWALAPLIESSGFWQEHFPWAHPSEPLPFFVGFLLAGALAGALWPTTWEGELLERTLRALGWTFLLYWLLAIVLEAPRAAGVVVLPVLGGPAFTAFRVARRAPEGSVRPYVAAACAVAGALALILLVVLPLDWAGRFILLPVPIAAYVLGPALLLRDVRERHLAAQRATRPATARAREESDFFLDLPPGTLRPPATLLGVIGAVLTVLFLVVVAAPGVPLSGPVAWVVLTLSLPAVVWSVLRREGIAHPRRIVAPPHVHVHTARVQHIRDQDLERLDEAILRFVRTGRGRRDLAAALAVLLAPSVPNARQDQLEPLLARLPRAPWRRRAREDGVAHLLGGAGILKAVREGGRA